jgi:hypothetical protein
VKLISLKECQPPTSLLESIELANEYSSVTVRDLPIASRSVFMKKAIVSKICLMIGVDALSLFFIIPKLAPICILLCYELSLALDLAQMEVS